MKKFIILAVLVLSTTMIPSDIALAWHWKPWRPWSHKHYYHYITYRPTYVIYSSVYDLNHDGIIDVRDRLWWVHKNYVPNSVVKITIVTEQKNFLCELDLNKDGIIESSEMAYWISKYDINKNGVLEENEINIAI